MNSLQGYRRRHAEGAECKLWSVSDLLAGATLFLAPLAMGGRHPWGRLVYVALIGLLTVTWLLASARDKLPLRRSGIEMIACLGLLIVLAQSIPLPVAWRHTLSPQIDTLLPAWQDADGVVGHSWRTLSLTPHATRLGGWIYIAHFAWFTFWVQRLRHEGDIRRALKWVGASGCWIALFGIAQYLFGNGKFLWFYANPFRTADGVLRGPFYNENHCAHFMALAWPCLWWWLGRVPAKPQSFQLQATRPSSQGTSWILGLGLIGLLFAGALTRSRGGILALGLAVVASVGLFKMATPGRDRRWSVLASVAVALLAALMVHGWSEVTTEVATLTSASLEEIDQHGARRALWNAAWQLAQSFPVLGVGIGGFRDAFPLHYDPPQQVDYSYAESGYLHLLAETGFAGFSLLLCFLVLVVARWCSAWRQSTAPRGLRAELAACGAALLVSFFHSLFDFIWFIPACLNLTLVLLACVWRIEQLSRSSLNSSDSHRTIVVENWAWQAAAMVLLLGVALLLPSARGSSPWEEYLRVVNDEMMADHDTATDEMKLESLATCRHLLERTVSLDAHHARARVLLAGICLREFELRQNVSDNPMALSQIRDAALSSQFSSRAAQDAWIDRVVGKRRILLHCAQRNARTSLQSSPLQGDAYLYLSELSFLTDPRPKQQKLWTEQAMSARPLSSSLKFAAGQQAILQGDIPTGLQLWKRAYQSDPMLRPRIAQQLAGRIPMRVFLEQFEPELADLVGLYQACEENHADSDATLVAKWYVDQIMNRSSSQRSTSRDWQQAYTFAGKIGDARARQCAMEAVRLDPENYTLRRRWAMELYAAGEYLEAAVQLEWCLRQTPRDAGLHGKLAMAREQMAIRR